MVTVRFDAAQDLIFLNVKIAGRRSPRKLWFVLDTGCAETLITPEAADQVGYSARDGEDATTVTSAVGREAGYQLRVGRLTALGHTRTDFRVNVHDLPDELGIDGLLGLNFLRDLNYEIRSREGRIVVERA